MFRGISIAWLAVVLIAGGLAVAGGQAAEKLPLPRVDLPEPPPFVPTVITAGGQRLLLAHTELELRWDAEQGRPVANRPGWWVINYPLDRIAGLEGRDEDEVAALLFGRPADAVRNWYHLTVGEPVQEPEPPTGPAPVTPTAGADLVVDAGHAEADDEHAGTADRPLRTIQAAVDRAAAGTVIHVRPGVYREQVQIGRGGTVDRPVRIEGRRDGEGNMPVITGNDPFPADAWQPVAGFEGVHRAELFTELPGTVSMGGRTLIERDVPGQLEPGEFAINRASRRFLEPELEAGVEPSEGQAHAGRTWRRVEADEQGYIHLGEALGEAAAEAVVWASTWVWLDPDEAGEVQWHPDHPEPIVGRVRVGDRFRAARQSGTALGGQQNRYAVWVNGERLPAIIRARTGEPMGPRASRNHGTSDRWEAFPLRQGWNHLLFQLDTTARPEDLRFRFATDYGLPDELRSAASPPADRAEPPSTGPAPHVTEYLLLGPFETAGPDRGVYVRLPDDADPNGAAMDLAARRDAMIEVEADFVHVRGFEVRHGAQFQQRALVHLDGEGVVLEGCLIRDSEVKGISASLAGRDRSAEPIVVRNNWILRPGNTGIGSSGSSDELTPENLDVEAPGRGRILYDHNRIEHANWAGFPPMWESGGIKDFRLTGSVIRHTTVLGGHGPGIWLDWEHYNNRVEANLLVGVRGVGVGVEASPGPNLVANNVVRGLRPGQVWFRGGLISWDSARTWTAHNTIDGLWDETENWQGYRGTECIRRGYQADRGTRWCPLEHFRHRHVNNLVIGCRIAIGSHADDGLAGNLTDDGRGAEPMPGPPEFARPEIGDYRFAADHPAAAAGVDHELTRHVRHDFFGLPRFEGGPRAVGAFRREPTLPEDARIVTEIEWTDGTLERIIDGRSRRRE